MSLLTFAQKKEPPWRVHERWPQTCLQPLPPSQQHKSPNRLTSQLQTRIGFFLSLTTHIQAMIESPRFHLPKPSEIPPLLPTCSAITPTLATAFSYLDHCGSLGSSPISIRAFLQSLLHTLAGFGEPGLDLITPLQQDSASWLPIALRIKPSLMITAHKAPLCACFFSPASSQTLPLSWLCCKPTGLSSLKTLSPFPALTSPPAPTAMLPGSSGADSVSLCPGSDATSP